MRDSSPVRFLGLLFVVCVGCTPATDQGSSTQAPSPLVQEPYDCVLIMPVDKSGSFVDLMKPGGKGLEFANQTITHYFHDRLGNNDYLVVSQMSGNRQALLWQGSPRQLRNEFGNIGEWAEFMDKKSDAAGSRIWDGLSDSLEIVMTDPSMWNNHTRVVVVCLSDMENNIVDSFTSEQRLMRNLKEFAKKGGIIGLYFVGTQETFFWRKKLQELGFKNFVVEPATTAKPRFPSFE